MGTNIRLTRSITLSLPLDRAPCPLTLRRPRCVPRLAVLRRSCARPSPPASSRIRHADRWHERSTPIFGGVGIFAGLSRRASGSRSRWARSIRPRSCSGSTAASPLMFVAGLVDDLRHLTPLAKLAAQIARGRDRARDRARMCSSSTTRSLAGAIAMVLARRHDERVQPARQHGRARRDARRHRVRLLRDRRRDRPSEPRGARVALAGALACAASCPSTSGPGERRSSSWATPARSCSASRSPGSGSPSSWKVAGTTVATLLAADPRARSADPRHDARHRRPPARGPADLAGRPRPQLAPARALRPVREATPCRCSRSSRPRSARRASPTTSSTTSG